MSSATGSPSANVAEEESLLTESQQLDQQILAAEDEIAALQHRRAVFSAHILANPPSAVQMILPPSARIPAESNLTSETISKLRTKHQTQSATSLRAVHRLATSATTFETRDPDPAAADNGFVFGIRIEVFSSSSREFLTPYYLLLNRPWRASRQRDEYCLHRHTFPPFVPVKEICRKWLPAPKSEDEDRPERKQDLQRLTQELRRYVASYHRREDAVSKMGRSNSDYVSRITLPDAENLEARVYLKNGSTADIRIDAKGKIQKVTAKDDVGRKLYALERAIERQERIEAVDFAKT